MTVNLTTPLRALPSAPLLHPGALIGSVERTYGLMRCTGAVSIRRVIGTFGDLAVADRVAFRDAREHGEQRVVLGCDRTWWVVALDSDLASQDVERLRIGLADVTLMSVASRSGVVPLVD